MIVHPRWTVTCAVTIEAPSEDRAIECARDRMMFLSREITGLRAVHLPDPPADDTALAFLAHAAAGEGCCDTCPGYFRNVDTDLIERCDDCAHEIGVAGEVDDEMVRAALVEMTNDRGVLRFRCADDGRLYTLADMLAANPGDEELAEWMRAATAGDTWGLDVTAVLLAT